MENFKHFYIYDNCATMAQKSAIHILKLSQKAIEGQGFFTCAFSGGRTPISLFKELALFPLEWGKCHFFLVDERMGDEVENSNFFLLQENLQKKLPTTLGGIYPILRKNPQESAVKYQETVLSVFQNLYNDTSIFQLIFDCIQLGIGDDGHVGSIFHDVSENNNKNIAIPIFKANTPPFVERVSLTLNTMACAKNILFLLSGDQKITFVHEVISGKHTHTPISNLFDMLADNQVSFYMSQERL